MTPRRIDPLQRRAFRANGHAALVLGWRRSDLVEAIDKEAHYVPEAQP